MQVLPFVESYFVLCAARADQVLQPESLSRMPSSDLGRAASYSLPAAAVASVPPSADAIASTSASGHDQPLQPAVQDQLPEQRKAWIEAHLPYLRCEARTSISPLLHSQPFDCTVTVS